MILSVINLSLNPIIIQTIHKSDLSINLSIIMLIHQLVDLSIKLSLNSSKHFQLIKPYPDGSKSGKRPS